MGQRRVGGFPLLGRQFEHLHERARELSIKGGGWEMWGRANQNALLLAGIVAVGINAKQPLIT